MRRGWVLAVGAAAVVGVCAGLVLHNVFASHAAQAAAAPKLRGLWGEATWRAGTRPAPAFALRDGSGRLVSMRSLRGRTVVLTFMDSLCTNACPIQAKLLAAAVRAVAPAQRPQVVVVSVHPGGDTPATARRAIRKWRLPASTMWLLGTRRALAPVWKRYEITVQPATGDIVHSTALYLIDRNGDERAGVLMPFTPGLVSRDLRLLAAA